MIIPTPQELFNTVARALIAQGRPALDANGNCVYRAPDGCKCAAGHVIPDDKYKPEFETLRIWGVPYFTEWPGEMRTLLSRLQDAHDLTDADEHWLANWKVEMRRLALHHGLSFSVLGEVKDIDNVD